ncbi:hypothetical protein BV881_23970 [Streptomyces sp. ZL-24]|uniref:hypothetical protein n=1 Tax=Streptomyces sp. ZL-24 TaxID=1933029 RepID=UPI000CD3F630|nr:hypothetical protein [Streptomyces sp. ZL-24]POG44907.1 hypothetical protein BV881_23970 [Streptomyces sp. ZL-24]
MTWTPRTDDAVAATLDAAAKLSPVPGYINGDDYGEWYIEADPVLLRALSQLALAHGSAELAARLETLCHPLCMEPLDDVLTPGTMPRQWCGTPVGKSGIPCEEHVPERAGELGRCTWVEPDTEWTVFPRRICRDAPVPDDDRCRRHAALCRAVQRNKKVCNRPDCTIPKHQEAAAGR